jgi:hypothetical protein
VLATLPESVSVNRPTALSLIISAAPAGLIFEVIVIIPIYLALRHWRRLAALPFVVIGSAAWFLVTFSLMLLVTNDTQVASATAFASFLPGAIAVAAFWFIGGAKHGA